MKRLLDVIFAVIGIVALAPVLAVIAIALKLRSPGPVLYRGVRIGLRGVPFQMLKFRTMVVGAERLGGSATAGDDPRLTLLGIRLRRFKLDELPQLINVLKGEMSFVGPRPEVEKYVGTYSGPEAAILDVRPGITDWASIWDADEGAALAGSSDPEADYERFIRPVKLRLQLYYVHNRSVLADLKIILHTLIKLIHSGWIPRELARYGTAVELARKIKNANRPVSLSDSPAEEIAI